VKPGKPASYRQPREEETRMSGSEEILGLPAPEAGVLRSAYGASRYQFGDLRLPSSPSPHALYPVVIGVHGGYYRARYGLSYFGHVMAALTEVGCATWNVEYRRLGNRGGGWPGTFQDVAAAADYVRTLAATYPLDLERVLAIGHSAGGHLACWLAARPRLPAGDPLYTADPIPVSGVVSLAGVLDLRRAYTLRLSDGVVQKLMGGTPEQHPERYAAASPMDLLPLRVPQILIHGTKDSSVPYDFSASYWEVAHAAGDSVELVTQQGAGHFDMVDPRANEWRAVLHAVRKEAGLQ
jgi:acetyl esterase/lipase